MNEEKNPRFRYVVHCRKWTHLHGIRGLVAIDRIACQPYILESRFDRIVIDCRNAREFVVVMKLVSENIRHRRCCIVFLYMLYLYNVISLTMEVLHRYLILLCIIMFH